MGGGGIGALIASSSIAARGSTSCAGGVAARWLGRPVLWRRRRGLRRRAGVVDDEAPALASATHSPMLNLLDAAAAGLEATSAAAFSGKKAQKATAKAGCRCGWRS